MIFVSVGSQAPFDRLIRAVDQWAGLRGHAETFAQIAKGSYHPAHMKFTDFVAPSEFRRLAQSAQLIVAHAGMGSIIAALEMGKPIVVMPRRACFSETRNDHQVAAARHFGEQGRVIVALDEQEIPEKLDAALNVRDRDRIDTKASPQLLFTIRSFLADISLQSRVTESKKLLFDQEPWNAVQSRALEKGDKQRSRN